MSSKKAYTGKTWAVNLTSTFAFDFHSEPHVDLAHIDWEQAKGVQKSSKGSQGVYFVSLPSGAVVVKGSNAIANEVFCSQLAACVGIRTPHCRIVPFITPLSECTEEKKESESEGQQMYRKLCELDRLQPVHRTVKSNLARRYLLVMEFCRAQSLFELASKEQVASLFSQPAVGGHTGLSQQGETVLEQLGRVAGLDLFLHNTDRFPLVVDNRGNVGNLLVDSATAEAICIDTFAACIDPVAHEANFLAYKQKVQGFLAGLPSSHRCLSAAAAARPTLQTTVDDEDTSSAGLLPPVAPLIGRVRDALLASLNFDIDFGGCRCVGGREVEKNGSLHGSAAGLQECSHLHDCCPGSRAVQRGIEQFLIAVQDITLDKLKKLKADIAYQQVEGEDGGMVGLQEINMEYLAAMLDLLHSHQHS